MSKTSITLKNINDLEDLLDLLDGKREEYEKRFEEEQINLDQLQSIRPYSELPKSTLDSCLEGLQKSPCPSLQTLDTDTSAPLDWPLQISLEESIAFRLR